MEKNFKPLFKENKKGKQYFYKNDKWIKCGEGKICSLWSKWVISENTHRIIDLEGFTIYGHNIENK